MRDRNYWTCLKDYLRPFIGTLPSSGLLSLAAVLQERGYPVKIVESASLGLSLSQTLKDILQEKPRYVGLTCTTASVVNAARIARAIKEKSSKILTFVGGPHITALPEETFRRYPAFDYGVIGEGEMAFSDLLQAVDKNGEFRRVENAVFRQGNEVFVNPRSFTGGYPRGPTP